MCSASQYKRIVPAAIAAAVSRGSSPGSSMREVTAGHCVLRLRSRAYASTAHHRPVLETA
eukprot:3937404-Rhodomonas_salina.1